MDKDTYISHLERENGELRELVTKLLIRIEALEKEIVSLGIKKDSSNSHLPPSTDIKKNQSLRKKSGKPVGGQQGHQGNHLEMRVDVDAIEDLLPNFCNSCGASLSDQDKELVSCRQVVDIPPISPIYKEYRQYGILCSCGHKQLGTYPLGVTAPIQYGSSIEALVVYQNVYQYIAYERISHFFKDVFHLAISAGTLVNMVSRMSAKAQPLYERLREEVAQSSQVGADETSSKVNGDKWWVWVWQSLQHTYIHTVASRGKSIIDQLFPHGFSNAVLHSDRWAAHLNTKAKGHQLCLAHLLRDLNYLIELEKSNWAIDFKEWLLTTIRLKKEISQSLRGSPQTQIIEEDLDKLLQTQLEKDLTPKTLTFQTSMVKNKAFLTPFLYQAETTSDNNASERAIRNIKVKQKVSGQFKSGQQHFCVLRSVIDTCKKKQTDILAVLNLIALNNVASE